MRMMRLAITREEDGGREVPVPISVRGKLPDSSFESGVLRLKNRVGTEPQVSVAMNVAVAEAPGWR